MLLGGHGVQLQMRREYAKAGDGVWLDVISDERFNIYKGAVGVTTDEPRPHGVYMLNDGMAVATSLFLQFLLRSALLQDTPSSSQRPIVVV